MFPIYEKNTVKYLLKLRELCEALHWEWCLYDVCSTRLYCYDLHLLPAVQKVQPASQAEAVTSLNNFTVPGLFQACTSHAFTPHSTQTLKYDDRNVFLHQITLRQKNVYFGGKTRKTLIIISIQYHLISKKTHGAVSTLKKTQTSKNDEPAYYIL